MANQKDIEIKIKVDAKDANKDTLSMEKSLELLSDTLSDLTIVLEKSFTNLGDSINENTDNLKNYNKVAEDTAEAQDKVAESSKKTGGGLKGIASGFGAILKASGIVGLFLLLWEAMQKNQKIMDAIEKVMTIIGIVFNTVTEAIVNAYESVSEATGGFDAMKKVIVGLLTVAITPLKLSFYAIKAALLSAQLAWEQSFLGGKDPQKIAELKASLKEVKDDVIQTGKDAVEAGKSIANNIGEAIGEVGSLVKAVATNVTNAVKTMSIATIASQADMLVAARKAYAELEIQQKGLDLKYKQQQEVQRQIRDNVNLTTEERIKANAELGRLLNEQLGKEQNLLNEKIKIAKLELSIDKDNHEKKLALMQLQIVDQAELNERITGMKSEQIANEQGLLKEAADKKLADEQEALNKSNEQIKKNQDAILAIYRYTEEEKLKITRDNLIKQLEETTLSEQEKVDAKKEIEENYAADMKKIADEAAEAEQEAKDKQKEEDKKDREDRIAKAKEEAEAILAIMQQASALISAITTLRYQNESNEMTKSQQEQLDNFKGSAKEKAALEKKFAQDRANLEYKYAKQQKAEAIVSAAINTALAITAALTSLKAPFIMAGLAAALGAAQIAVIASTKIEKPQFGRGGVLQGASHANGGILTPFGELEGGEGVINNGAMSNPNLRNMASAANEAGGGVSFGNGQGINLSQSSINGIVNGINSKKVILSMSELQTKNDQITLIDNESYL